MNKEELLNNKDFYKSFKNGENLTTFFKEMHNGKPPIRRFVFNCLDRWDVFKVRKNSKVINKIIYLAVGLNREGKKEVFGIWLDKNKSSSFWMGVLTNLKACGAEDILILQLII